MPKKLVRMGPNPEGSFYFVEVPVPKLKKTKDGVPEPPDNFPPVGGEETVLVEEGPHTFPGTNITSTQLEESEKRGGLFTHAAYTARALEEKEK